MAQISYIQKLTGSANLIGTEGYRGVMGYSVAGTTYTIGLVTSGSSGNYYNFDTAGHSFTFGIDSGIYELEGHSVTTDIRFPAGKYVLIPNVFNSSGDL